MVERIPPDRSSSMQFNLHKALEWDLTEGHLKNVSAENTHRKSKYYCTYSYIQRATYFLVW